MNIIIIASVGKIDDTVMSMSVFRDDTMIARITDWPDDKCRLELEIDIPCKLHIRVDGKGLYDTLVDPDGNILSDKFVKIEGIALDKIWIKKWMLESKILDFRADNGSISTSNYLSTNGTATMNIPYKDPLECWLEILALDQ